MSKLEDAKSNKNQPMNIFLKSFPIPLKSVAFAFLSNEKPVVSLISKRKTHSAFVDPQAQILSSAELTRLCQKYFLKEEAPCSSRIRTSLHPVYLQF